MEIHIIIRGHLFKIRLGGLFDTPIKPEKENAASASELERLEQIRKLKEELKATNIPRTDIMIEDTTIKKF